MHHEGCIRSHVKSERAPNLAVHAGHPSARRPKLADGVCVDGVVTAGREHKVHSAVWLGHAVLHLHRDDPRMGLRGTSRVGSRVGSSGGGRRGGGGGGGGARPTVAFRQRDGELAGVKAAIVWLIPHLMGADECRSAMAALVRDEIAGAPPARRHDSVGEVVDRGRFCDNDIVDEASVHDDGRSAVEAQLRERRGGRQADAQLRRAAEGAAVGEADVHVDSLREEFPPVARYEFGD